MIAHDDELSGTSGRKGTVNGKTPERVQRSHKSGHQTEDKTQIINLTRMTHERLSQQPEHTLRESKREEERGRTEKSREEEEKYEKKKSIDKLKV